MTEQFMIEAIGLSQEKMRRGDGGPFGAVVVHDGQIVGRGWNRVTSTNDPTAHAEIMAIRDACHRREMFHLLGCDIYCSCEPCPMCLGAIYWARLSRIYFAASREDAACIGFQDELLYREISLLPENRMLPAEQLLRERAVLVMNEWQRLPGRVEY